MLRGGTLVADIMVRQRGYAGQRVPLVVEDGGRIVSRDSITLPPDGDVAPVRISVAANDPGARSLTFRIPTQPGEQVTQNNAQQALVDVRDDRESMLYFEGTPRPEMKFIRAAVEADSNLQIVTLQRTAENKFYRLNVDSANDLVTGFPKTRAELFRYRSIILGDVEASFFTHDQLAMLADFVNVRGGGLLLLGGRRAFAEGGYAGTPLADVMPVVIAGDAVPDSLTFFANLKVALTPAGESHAVAQIAPTPSRSAERWKSLPPVTTVNRIREVKPGAVTLVTGSIASGGRAGMPGAPVRSYDQPVLVYQRYGRGLSVAFPIQDSWVWQMDPNTPADDDTFSRFWRQMLRWITSDSPGRVVASLPTDKANPRSPDRDPRDGDGQHLHRAQRREGRRAHHERQRSLARPAARLGDRPRRRVPRHVHARPGRDLHDPRHRDAPERRVRGRHDLPARRGPQHRVLRRRDARAAAQAHRDGDGRPLLHARDGVHAGGRRRDEQARRHRRESDGSVGHAGDLPAARGARERGVGVSEVAGARHDRWTGGPVDRWTAQTAPGWPPRRCSRRSVRRCARRRIS